MVLLGGSCKVTGQCIVVTDHWKAKGWYDKEFDKHKESIEKAKVVVSKPKECYRVSISRTEPYKGDYLIVLHKFLDNQELINPTRNVTPHVEKYLSKRADHIQARKYGSDSFNQAKLSKRFVSKLFLTEPLATVILETFTSKDALRNFLAKSHTIRGEYS